MGRIRDKDTKPEKTLRKALWHRGYRYRKNYKKLPGSPDIVITKHKIAIFVDGVFWHGKDFNEAEKEGRSSLKERLSNGSNAEFWLKKITRNMERDSSLNAELKGAGWTVLRFWETDIMRDLDGCIKAVEECIFDNNCKIEEE